MNSEVVAGGGRKSREHRRYLSIGQGSESGAIFEEESSSRPGGRGLLPQAGIAEGEDGGMGGGGKENVAGPRDVLRIFGGMTRLGPPGGGAKRGGESPAGSMYDGDGFLKGLDAWLR